MKMEDWNVCKWKPLWSCLEVKAVHLRVLTGREVFGAELQRLEEECVAALCPKEQLQCEHQGAWDKPIKLNGREGEHGGTISELHNFTIAYVLFSDRISLKSTLINFIYWYVNIFSEARDKVTFETGTNRGKRAIFPTGAQKRKNPIISGYWELNVFLALVSFNWGIQWSPNTIKSSLFRQLSAIADICRAALGILWYTEYFLPDHEVFFSPTFPSLF